MDEINLVLLDLPADCALFSFAQGDFRQSDVRLGAFLQQPTGTRACLTDFTWFGAESFSCEADSTWMVILVAQNEYMAVVLDPCAGTTETEVSLAGLDWGASPFTADFSAANPFTVDASTAPILDWSGFSTTSLGEPFTPEEARYLRVLNTPIPVDDLAVSWLDAWANPTVSWQAMVAWLSSADLAACKDSDDAHFPGFTSEGTWLVALMADRCPPSAMAVVEVKD